MNRKCLVLTIGVGLLVASAGNAGSAGSATEVLKAYVEAMNAHDAGAVVALFEPNDRVVSIINGQVAVGVEAIRKSGCDLDSTALEIVSVRGSILGEQSVLLFATLGTTTEGKAVDDAILLTLVVEHGDGGWKITHQHATETDAK